MSDLDEDSELLKLYRRMDDGSSSSSRLKNEPPDAKWTRRPNTVSRKRSFMERDLLIGFDEMKKGKDLILSSTKQDCQRTVV